MSQSTLDRQGEQVEYAAKPGSIRYGRNLHDTDHIRNLSVVPGSFSTEALDNLEARSLTQFIVGSDPNDPYQTIEEAVAAAKEVASESAWALVLVTSGDYGDGSIINFPPYVEIAAELKANRGGKNQSVSVHGGFIAVGKGPRKLSDIRLYSNSLDTHKLIEIPAMAAGFEVQLILDRCFLDDNQTSPNVVGRVIDTREPSEIIDSQIQSAVGNDNGVYPPIWIHGDVNFANMTSTDSSFTMVLEQTANEIFILMDGSANRSSFSMWGGFVSGHVKSDSSGGFGHADIFLSGVSSIVSNARSAVDLAHANSKLFAFGPSQLSGGGTYTVEGVGTLSFASMIFAFSELSLDPAVILSSQGGWYGYDPAVTADWNVQPIDVASALDELGSRVIGSGPWASVPVSGLFNGRNYFDEDSNKPYWYKGGTWYDAAGVAHP